MSLDLYFALNIFSDYAGLTTFIGRLWVFDALS